MASNGWEKFYGRGENANGFRSLTPNGVASDSGTGANHQQNWGVNINGPRWAMPMPEADGYGLPFIPAQGTVGTPRRGRKNGMNRTGE